jgi:hypothetical protein
MICLTNLDLNKNELQNAVLQPLAVAPSNPKLGQIYTDSSSEPKRIKWYNGTNWELVGVVYEQDSAIGKVITGLSSNGTVTVTNVKDLQLTGYTPVSGGYIAAGDSLESALKALDQAVQNAVAGGGEVNQFAFSNIKISTVTVSATGKTDTVEFIAGDNIQLTADAATKTITISAVVPTKLSELTNDEGFIDNTVSNLVNYYTKSSTYSKDEVNTLIGNLATISIQVVSSLPETGKGNIIYLIAKSVVDGEQNSYDEYLWTGTKFERIGDTSIDLSGYLQTTGNASNVTVEFSTSSSRDLPVTGEKLNILIGKIVKYLSDLKTVAFSGSYNDLSDKPTQVVKYITGTLTAGLTSTSLSFTGTFVSASIRDSVTGELIITDIDVSTNNATISIAQAHTNDLSISIMYS